MYKREQEQAKSTTPFLDELASKSYDQYLVNAGLGKPNAMRLAVEHILRNTHQSPEEMLNTLLEEASGSDVQRVRQQDLMKQTVEMVTRKTKTLNEQVIRRRLEDNEKELGEEE